MNQPRYVKLIINIVLVIILSSCDQSSKSTSKKLIMGTSADYPPFEYIQAGEFRGLDIEIAQTIAKMLDYELEIKDLDFSSLILSLNSKVIDFSISAITPTIERQKNIDFSTQYYQGKPAIIVKKASLIKDINNISDKIIGVQFGSVWEDLAKTNRNEINNYKIFSANKINQLIEELKIDRIDLLLIDAAQAMDLTLMNPELIFYYLDQEVDGYAIAFAKNSPLKKDFDQALSELRNTKKLDSIINKWLKNHAN